MPSAPPLARFLLASALATSLGSCGGTEAAPNACVPGRTLPCDCTDGGTGVQSCLPDGSAFEACRSCSLPPSEPRAGFTDITSTLGFAAKGGACLALEDFDRDGTLDLLFSEGSSPSVVGIYKGLAGGSFIRPAQTSLGVVQYTVKCVTGDFDNDGLTDVVQVLPGKGPEGTAIEYWKNLGGMQFQLQDAGIDKPYMPDQFVVGVGVWDYDHDGWLDLVVGRLFALSGAAGNPNEACAFTSDADFRCLVPMSDKNPGPRVFRNDKGTFRLAEGVLKPPFPLTTNAIAIADLNRDGKTDLLLSNDYFVNHVHLSTPTGYEHAENELGMGDYNHGMGITVGDFDGDLNLDVYGVDVGPNNLWFGNSSGPMTNRALDLGIAAATHFHSNWAPMAEDFDLDGKTDLFVAAAAVVTNDEDMVRMANSSGKIQKIVPQYDLMFWNENHQGFSQMKLPHRGQTLPNVIHAVAANADTDGDGDLDILVGVGTPLQFRYLRNEQPPGHWLVVDVEGTKSNRDGIGVEVQLVEGGVVKQLRTIGGQGSLGQSWRRAHFGLGERDLVEEVRVRWTTGKTQSLTNIKANQTLLVTEE